MSFFEILGNVLIGPLKLVFELIYGAAYRFVDHPGIAIIFLSLVMNILVLPLYRRADAMQEEARDTEARLRPGVEHIKKTFSGDERMMIMQAYYRQEGYKPTSGLKGSVSLLLEIPFFMAAYQFLSSLSILNGVSFGPIADLGKPDGLLVIGSLSINLLPVLMTLINCVSSYLYLKGFPLKTKIQLYAMALFFLVFLYTSPSALVFYWTLNNLFSLVKTIFYKLKNPMAVIRIITSAAGIALIAYGALSDIGINNSIIIMAIGLGLEIPLLGNILDKKNEGKSEADSKKQTEKAKAVKASSKPDKKLFVLGSLFLTLLVGVLIPSAYIAASPQEFVDMGYYHNPLWYVVSALCLAAGTFMVWVRVFYWLASDSAKRVFEKLVWVLCGVAFINYMFFGTGLGVISSTLKYEEGMHFAVSEQVLNAVAVIALAAVMLLVISKWRRVVSSVLALAIVASVGMSVWNVVGIKSDVDEIHLGSDSSSGAPLYTLSEDGKNVVVIMLDRAMGEYVPFMFAEKPELADMFAGFTYYDNVVSFGGFTNMGVPALLGGYEYTPVEMNKRAEEALVSKHNEALKVMPTLFADSGYDVTVCDPTYANYKWIPDLSIFDDNPDIKTYITKGKFGDPEQKKAVVSNNRRNFFLFSLMKSLPLMLQRSMYNGGRYNQLVYEDGVVSYGTQALESTSKAQGMSVSFMDPYNVLASMSYITDTTKGKGSFIFLSNDACHEPMLLQTPDYVPAEKVDNTVYEAERGGSVKLGDRELLVDTDVRMIHYHANMASFLQLGKWFDTLREKGVYDNTRIILVSDHGRYLGQTKELVMDNGSDKYKNASMYFPLLMVKDFDSKTFTTSHEFMTNADVPTLATAGLIDSPVNPFTGKAINSSEKTAHEQFISLSGQWDVKINNGNTFMEGKWASVKDDIWVKDNWTFYSGKTVLDEHKAP